MDSSETIFGKNPLVLKEFSINAQGPEYVHIVARKPGFIAWFLTMLGIQSTTTFRVLANRIEFEGESLSTNLLTSIPLRSISIATCRYKKPYIFILAAILSLFVYPLLALLFILLYYCNKSLLISFVSDSSYPAKICFQSSIIEGVNLKYKQTQKAIQMINELICASK